jgi:hypothetical protein
MRVSIDQTGCERAAPCVDDQIGILCGPTDLADDAVFDVECLGVAEGSVPVTGDQATDVLDRDRSHSPRTLSRASAARIDADDDFGQGLRRHRLDEIRVEAGGSRKSSSSDP